MVSLSESSFILCSRHAYERTGDSLAGHVVVLEEAIAGHLLFDDFDDVKESIVG